MMTSHKLSVIGSVRNHFLEKLDQSEKIDGIRISEIVETLDTVIVDSYTSYMDYND